MDEQQLYKILDNINFAQDYYKLCAEYPYIPRGLVGPRGKKEDVLLILNKLKRKPSYDKQDKSYFFSEDVGALKCELVFNIQAGRTVEFSLAIREKEKIIAGSNYSVLASNCAYKPTDLKAPFPRPVFHSVQDLEVILTEEFSLANRVIETIKKDRF